VSAFHAAAALEYPMNSLESQGKKRIMSLLRRCSVAPIATTSTRPSLKGRDSNPGAGARCHKRNIASAVIAGMSAFKNHLGLILYEDRQGKAILSGPRTQWFVNPPLSYERGGVGSGEVFTVPGANPVGWTDAEILAALLARRIFISDLGTTPEITWSFGYAPNGPESKAFVLHDYGCANKGFEIGHRYNPDGSITPISCTCREVHDMLLEAMLVVGVKEHHARVIHEAVLIGGRSGELVVHPGSAVTFSGVRWRGSGRAGAGTSDSPNVRRCP
jgi:hypothetical protein